MPGWVSICHRWLLGLVPVSSETSRVFSSLSDLCHLLERFCLSNSESFISLACLCRIFFPHFVFLRRFSARVGPRLTTLGKKSSIWPAQPWHGKLLYTASPPLGRCTILGPHKRSIYTATLSLNSISSETDNACARWWDLVFHKELDWDHQLVMCWPPTIQHLNREQQPQNPKEGKHPARKWSHGWVSTIWAMCYASTFCMDVVLAMPSEWWDMACFCLPCKGLRNWKVNLSWIQELRRIYTTALTMPGSSSSLWNASCFYGPL